MSTHLIGNKTQIVLGARAVSRVLAQCAEQLVGVGEATAMKAGDPEHVQEVGADCSRSTKLQRTHEMELGALEQPSRTTEFLVPVPE